MQKYLTKIFEKKYAVLAVFTLAVCILYYKAFFIGFLSDDFGFIWQAKEYGWSAFEHNFNDPFFIPLSHVIALSVYTTVGENALIFHIIQLLVHALIGWQLYLFLKEYLSHKTGVNQIAFLSAFLFLIYPYQTEAVIWLSSKSYGYSLFFGLLCIRQFFKYYDSKKNIHLILSSLFLICSITTKEFGYVLPFAIILLLWSKGRLGFKVVPVTVFTLIIGISITLRWVILSEWIGGYGADTHFKLPVIAWHYAAYVIKFFTYIRFADTLFYSMTLLTIVSFFWVLISFIKTSAIRKQVLVLIALFILTLFPIVSLEITSWQSIESDRYGYWASVIVCVSLVLAIYQLPKILSKTLPIIWGTLFIGLTLNTITQWSNADQIKETYLSGLEDLPDSNLLIVNAPDNFNGAYVLRNGIKEYLKIKEAPKTVTVLEYQSFSNVNGGVLLLDNLIYQDSKGAEFYYLNPKIDSTSNNQIDLEFFNDYDGIYYFNQGNFFKIEHP